MSARQVDIDKWESIPCECGTMAKRATLHYKHYEVRGWQCGRCGKAYIHPENSLKVNKLEKLKREKVKVKVGVVGESMMIRIPKEVSGLYGLKKGEEVTLIPDTLRKLHIEKE
jgi:hypothetical protein